MPSPWATLCHKANTHLVHRNLIWDTHLVNKKVCWDTQDTQEKFGTRTRRKSEGGTMKTKIVDHKPCKVLLTVHTSKKSKYTEL